MLHGSRAFYLATGGVHRIQSVTNAAQITPRSRRLNFLKKMSTNVPTKKFTPGGNNRQVGYPLKLADAFAGCLQIGMIRRSN